MSLTDPYRANEFYVEIDHVKSPTISKVTGLKLGQTEPIEVPEAGSNVVHKVSSGVVKFDALTIERYVDGSEDDQLFKSFFEEMFKINQRTGIGSNARRDIAIVKTHFNEEKLRFMVYGAWVKSVSFTDLEAGSNSLLKQTIELEHEGLEWI